MRIAKPLLLITTPVGLAAGIYEAVRLTGGLAFLMVAMILMIGAMVGMLVMTVRREQRMEQVAQQPSRAARATADGEVLR
jgi:hypothetical protein